MLRCVLQTPVRQTLGGYLLPTSRPKKLDDGRCVESQSHALMIKIKEKSRRRRNVCNENVCFGKKVIQSYSTNNLMYGSLIKKHKLFCSEISLPWNGHSKAKSQGHELWSETRREVRRALQGRGRIAVPRAPSVDEECMRRPARPGVPIGPRTGPEALPILWGVRSEETI